MGIFPCSGAQDDASKKSFYQVYDPSNGQKAPIIHSPPSEKIHCRTLIYPTYALGKSTHDRKDITRGG
ncbi:MAG: hypothetical protein CVV33_04260 [Methanomicrobiales archaeon HGW-Methanomicrobiales-4]|nr:MAG: hypothetical protein CVV33_04260 [Methanomicrobiales archaeon HGW-Methanomicrobiales-4]